MTAAKLRALKNTLIRKGVSYRHASRYVRELEQHYDDLFVEAKGRGMNDRTAAFMAEQALGDERDLVDAMAGRPELQSFGSRYPKLCFLVLPLLSFIVTCAGLIFAFIGIVSILGPSSEMTAETVHWLRPVVEAIRLFLMHGLAPLLSLFFLAYGLRQQVAGKLLFAGVLLANLMGCALLLHVQIPDPEAGITEGFFGATIGYGLYDRARDVMDTKYRLLLTMAFLLLFSWWCRSYLVKE